MRALLTPPAIARLKPELGRRREIKDGGTRGLYLVIQPSGAKSWAMRFRRPGGKWGKLVLGPLDLSNNELSDAPIVGQPLTVTAARQLAAQISRERALGKDVIEEHRTARRRSKVEREQATASTFGLLARQYIEEHARPNTRRWRETAKNLGWHYQLEGEPFPASGGLAERWADRPVTSIDGHDIYGAVDEARRRGIPGIGRRNEGLSDPRGRALGRTLSKFFAWLLEHRRIVVNPCIGVWKPPAPQARERVLTNDEIRLFWQAANTLASPFGPVLKLLLITGQRLGEVSGMRRDELRNDGTWHLPGSRTKNRKPHVVPLSPLATELIKTVPLIEACPFVFSTTGLRPVSGWSKLKVRLDTSMQNLSNNEIEPWTLHDLRRTAVTGMADLGIAPHIVEAVVNHISGARAGVAGTYNRAEYAAEKEAALARWTAHVIGLIGNEPSNVVNMPSRKRKRR